MSKLRNGEVTFAANRNGWPNECETAAVLGASIKYKIS